MHGRLGNIFMPGKRTPINSHQFLTYFGNVGTSEPDDPNDIHNILIIRGDRESDQIRECTRGCLFPDDFSHSTKFSLVTPLRHPPAAPK
uniref:Uncharacterized protein n=1 Tax=Panagrolaimus superbus TaxID=310955 RepID=A0A914Y5B4_9BILA